ncbi:hypothetical protein BSL78_30118 [Apostichopus japonicus]|uniref:Uncharacterized protein n=1 Tax=Stichopus japonicus TaxID=307972 RepID=A0A2G8JBE1_STIJA|nr:hypothetical protein BSL78_30118 [Apostichopus japonicus]
MRALTRELAITQSDWAPPIRVTHPRLTSYRAELMEFGLVHILLGLVSFLLFLDGCRSQKKAFRKDQSDKKPNIIFILTDDQDVTMNGITPMKQTQKTDRRCWNDVYKHGKVQMVLLDMYIL